MAEFVQQCIEEMLPELEQMERVGLFTKEETRQILKKREAYEYKLRRRIRCKEDFLQYIQYEVNVLSLVRKRRKKTGYSFKKMEIDIAIIHRIHHLFRLALQRFQDDIKLWLSHIGFSKQMQQPSYVGRLFTRMLQIHTTKSNLWILAAKWEFEDNSNPENARSLLQRGLRFNPNDRKLWLEYYRMELLYTEKMRKRREILGANMPEVEDDVSDKVLQGTVAEIVFNKAKEQFPDVEFMLSLLSVTKLFDFTESQVEGIFESLKTLYPHSEKTWDAVARRNWPPPKGMKTKECLSNCYRLFDEAVEKINTECMWTYYLRFCLEIVQRKCSKKKRVTAIDHALSVFQRASSKSLLTSEMFVEWLNLSTEAELNEEARNIAKAATEKYSKESKHWYNFIRILTSSCVPIDEVLSVFYSAQASVPEKEQWSLYEVILDYCISCESSETTPILENAIKNIPDLSIPAKTFYLQWTFLKHGIGRARKLYQRFSHHKPVSQDFFKAYISMEKSQAVPTMKLIRSAYEDAVREFGDRDSDLWLDYIKLERESGGETANIGQIHYRALKTLKGELNQKFVTAFSLIQSGHMIDKDN